MVEDNFIFKRGKYSGKTYKFVKDTNPGYIKWAEENAPDILKEPKKKKFVFTPPSKEFSENPSKQSAFIQISAISSPFICIVGLPSVSRSLHLFLKASLNSSTFEKLGNRIK